MRDVAHSFFAVFFVFHVLTDGYGELFYSKFLIKVHTKAFSFLNLHPDWLHCDEFRPNIVLVYKNKLG